MIILLCGLSGAGKTTLAKSIKNKLAESDIFIEIIDVQSLLPFDIHKVILKSIQKTNSVVFFDEDVPGGGTAYMMQQVLEKQGGFHYLDTMPRTLTASENRVPYGRDGDYFCKPQSENLIRICCKILQEKDPSGSSYSFI